MLKFTLILAMASALAAGCAARTTNSGSEAMQAVAGVVTVKTSIPRNAGGGMSDIKGQLKIASGSFSSDTVNVSGELAIFVPELSGLGGIFEETVKVKGTMKLVNDKPAILDLEGQDHDVGSIEINMITPEDPRANYVGVEGTYYPTVPDSLTLGAQ